MRGLHDVIATHFNSAELEVLCFSIEVSPDELGGRTLRERALELVRFVGRRGQTQRLLDEIARERPALDLRPWGGPPHIHPSTSVVGVGTTSHSPSRVYSPPIEYENFDIRIHAAHGENRYPVEVTASPEGPSHELVVLTSPLANKEFQVLVQALSDLMVVPDEVKQLGRVLRDLLFPPPLWSLFIANHTRMQSAGKGLRIRLHIDPPELSRLPWEYCYDETFHYLALSRETPIVRYIPTNHPPPLPVSEPLRVLVALPNPLDLPYLDIEEEIARIGRALDGMGAAVEVKVLRHTTLTMLRQALVKDTHIFHFAGYGLTDGNDVQVLAFERETGEREHVNADQLRVLLQGMGVRLVVLNTSRSAGGMATALVHARIPAVIAMQSPQLTQEAAVVFSRELYEQLARGQTLERAVTEMRIGAYMEMQDSISWGIPVLFTSAPDGIIWQPRSPHSPRPTRATRPTISFAPSAAPVAEAWRQLEEANDPFLVEQEGAEADYHVRAADGAWIVQRQDGSEVEALRIEQTRRSAIDLAHRLDRMACYEQFVARAVPPPDPHSSEPFVGNVAVSASMAPLAGEPTLLVSVPSALPLPGAARVSFTLRNQGTTPRYVCLYRLDPSRHLIRRVWPTDTPTNLLNPDEATTAYWEDQRWEGGLLQLQVVVSSDPLEMEAWPCGRDGVLRGGSQQEWLEPLAKSPPRMEYLLTLGLAAQAPVARPHLFNQGDAHALLIGINTYRETSSLGFAVADAQALSAVLTDPQRGGYPPEQVTLLLEEAATRAAIESALKEAAQRCTPDSTFLFYFAGHVQASGEQESLLLTTQSAPSPQPSSPLDALEAILKAAAGKPVQPQGTSESISGAALAAMLDALPARHVIVLFDSCFGQGLPIRPGRVLLTGAEAGEGGAESPALGHGLFTHHLLAALSGEVASEDGLVRIFDLFEAIQPRVTQAERRNQRPILVAYPEDNLPVALYPGGGRNPPAVDTDGFRYDLYVSFADELRK